MGYFIAALSSLYVGIRFLFEINSVGLREYSEGAKLMGFGSSAEDFAHIAYMRGPDGQPLGREQKKNQARPLNGLVTFDQAFNESFKCLPEATQRTLMVYMVQAAMEAHETVYGHRYGRLKGQEVPCRSIAIAGMHYLDHKGSLLPQVNILQSQKGAFKNHATLEVRAISLTRKSATDAMRNRKAFELAFHRAFHHAQRVRGLPLQIGVDGKIVSDILTPSQLQRMPKTTKERMTEMLLENGIKPTAKARNIAVAHSRKGMEKENLPTFSEASQHSRMEALKRYGPVINLGDGKTMVPQMTPAEIEDVAKAATLKVKAEKGTFTGMDVFLQGLKDIPRDKAGSPQDLRKSIGYHLFTNTESLGLTSVGRDEQGHTIYRDVTLKPLMAERAERLQAAPRVENLEEARREHGSRQSQKQKTYSAQEEQKTANAQEQKAHTEQKASATRESTAEEARAEFKKRQERKAGNVAVEAIGVVTDGVKARFGLLREPPKFLVIDASMKEPGSLTPEEFLKDGSVPERRKCHAAVRRAVARHERFERLGDALKFGEAIYRKLRTPKLSIPKGSTVAIVRGEDLSAEQAKAIESLCKNRKAHVQWVISEQELQRLLAEQQQQRQKNSFTL